MKVSTMPSDLAHKIFALLATLGVFVVLGILMLRHSTLVETFVDQLRSSSTHVAVSEAKLPFTLPELVKLVKPSVVEITTYNASGDPDAVGSGFFTGPRQLISNWHVVDGCYRAEIKTSDGEIYPVKGVLASDKDVDLVLLDVEIRENKIRALKVAANQADEGERIVVIGNPLGLEGTVSDGIVSAIRDVPKLGRMMQVTAPVSHGSSGGPVVNMFGEVVGVARGMLNQGQNLNFAVPGNEIGALRRGALVSFAELHHQEAVGFYNEATQLAKNGSCNLAIPLYKSALAKDQNYEEAWLQLGLCEFKTSQFEDSLEAFKQAVRLNPQSDQPYYQAGRVAAELELWDAAAGYYRKALELNPRNDDAEFGLGLIFGFNGDSEGIQRIYRNLTVARSKRARELYEAYPELFTRPRSAENSDGTISLEIDQTTGLIAVEGCPIVLTKTFARGTEPKGYCGPQYHRK